MSKCIPFYIIVALAFALALGCESEDAESLSEEARPLPKPAPVVHNTRVKAASPGSPSENARKRAEELTPTKKKAGAKTNTPAAPARVASGVLHPTVQPVAGAMPVPVGLPKLGGPATEPKTEPGPAWFFVDDKLIKYERGEFKTIVKIKYTLAKQVLPLTNGNVVVLAGNKLHIVSPEGKLKTFEGVDKNRGWDHVIEGPNGELWISGVYGVASFDGKRFSFTHKDDLKKLSTAKKKPLFQRLTVDSNGTAWLAGYHAIAFNEGEGWKLVETDLLISMISFTKAGEAWAFINSGLLNMTDGGWTKTNVGFIPSPRSFRVMGEDAFVVANLSTIARIEGSGVSKLSTKDGSIAAQRFRTSSIDAQGRVWAGTDNGLFVIDAQDTITHYPPSTLDALTGKIDAIHVEGAGPELPSKGAEKKGQVRGALSVGGKLLPNIPVEMCSSASFFMNKGATPCSASPVKFQATTDAKGSFSFADVPRGEYSFVYKNGPKWTDVMGFKCCKEIKDGKTLNMGTIKMR